MKFHLTYLVISLALVILSCGKKDDAAPVYPIKYYSRLQKGNVWAYRYYEIDEKGTRTLTDIIDTVRIEKDTLINGKTLYIQTGTEFGTPFKQFLFDSAKTTWTYPNRRVILTVDKSLNYSETVSLDDIYQLTGNLTDSMYSVTDMSGNAYDNALKFKVKVTPKNPNNPYGTRYNNYYYARWSGLIRAEINFNTSGKRMEKVQAYSGLYLIVK